jgi:thioredoxin-related protein
VSPSDRPTRRQALLQGLALTAPAWAGVAWAAAAGAVTPAHAAESSLPVVDSLADALSRALARREPLVVMVSLHGCPFCKVVRDNYLQPLQAEGLPVVQVDMRQSRAIVDLRGQSMTHDQWVRQQGVRLAPTVLFFGRAGQEVAARLKGAYLPDFYNAYLEEQLAQARRAVQTT